MNSSPIRTADRMWHDVFLPDDVGHVRSRRVRRSRPTWHRWHERSLNARSRVDAFPWTAFKGLAAAGLFAVPFGKPHGAGLTHPMLATCIVAEEIAYESSSMGGVYDGQCILNAQGTVVRTAGCPWIL